MLSDDVTGLVEVVVIELDAVVLLANVVTVDVVVQVATTDVEDTLADVIAAA